jgi:hypothetical protein
LPPKSGLILFFETGRTWPEILPPNSSLILFFETGRTWPEILPPNSSLILFFETGRTRVCWSDDYTRHTGCKTCGIFNSSPSSQPPKKVKWIGPPLPTRPIESIYRNRPFCWCEFLSNFSFLICGSFVTICLLHDVSIVRMLLYSLHSDLGLFYVSLFLSMIQLLLSCLHTEEFQGKKIIF